MDPNLFFLDYDRLFEVLVTIVIFSFFIERALAVVFESKWFIEIYDDTKKKRKGLKEASALLLSVAVCTFWKLDAFSIIVVSQTETRTLGYFLTGAVVAKGVIIS